jgi:hypothetical protein
MKFTPLLFCLLALTLRLAATAAGEPIDGFRDTPMCMIQTARNRP